MSSPRNSSASSPSTSAFKRLCQAFSPKRSPRPSNASSSSSSICATSPKAFNEELIQRVFNYFDEDEDGKITSAELMTCMTAVGGCEMSLEEAEVAVETADSDGDGMLGFEDFSKILEETGSEEDEMKAAFAMYAAEGSGSITAKSLKKMLSRLGQSTSVQSCRAMICKFDLNGDGVLNFDEFRLMML